MNTGTAEAGKTAQSTGIVAGICVSRAKGECKTPVESAEFVAGQGIKGDAHAGDWHRQVSILADEDIDSVRRNGLPDIKPGAFAENLIISGLLLEKLGLGSKITIGAEAILMVTQIGKVCHTPCNIAKVTGDCIMPRLGLFARVERGGRAARGDTVTLLSEVPRSALQAVVLTISDRCSRGETEDTAGPAVASLLREKLGAHIYSGEIIPDEKDEIVKRMMHYSHGHNIDLVVAVGGTGFAPRDVTPEAARIVIEKFTPGLDEAMRLASMQKTPRAMLSRAVSGIRGQTLIITLPGSKRAAVENIESILPALGHGIAKLRGEGDDCGRPEGI